MRTHIVGTENRYYETEEEATAGCTPAAMRQLVARVNPDHRTWTVSRTCAMPIPPSRAIPLQSRLALASVILISVPETSRVVARNASLRDVYNLLRRDEESPERVATLPVLRQHTSPEDAHEYWRNMPQPV